MKKGESIVAMFVLAIMLVSTVSAIGVSSSYWGDNPLTMLKGETKTITLNLENTLGTKDETISATVTDGAAIASITQGTYLVKAGQSGVPVQVRISIPMDAEVGDTIKVTFAFNTIAPQGTGVISVATGVSKSFDVVVVEKEGKGLSTAWIVAIVVVVVILAWMIFAGKKKKKK